MDIEQARARIGVIRAAGERVTADELDQLWAVLETVRPEETLGSWQGSAFLWSFVVSRRPPWSTTAGRSSTISNGSMTPP